MTTTTYTITYAGYYESILRTTRSLDGHATIADAVAAFCCVGPMTVDEAALYEIDGGVLVYEDQEARDADSDGSRALAVIEPARDRA